jgi:hypothetical protein
MASLSPAGTFLTGQNRRRSTRVLLKVAVHISGTLPDGNIFQEEAWSLFVSAHGALLSVSIALPVGMELTLTHKPTRKSVKCKSVFLGKPQGDKAQVGIEFLRPSPMFWQIDFPAEDWVVPES